MGFRGSRVQIPPSRLLTNSRTDCRTDSGRRKPYSRGPESWAPRHIYLKALLRRRVLLRRAGYVVDFTALLELALARCHVQPRSSPAPGIAGRGRGSLCEREPVVGRRREVRRRWSRCGSRISRGRVRHLAVVRVRRIGVLLSAYHRWVGDGWGVAGPAPRRPNTPRHVAPP